MSANLTRRSFVKALVAGAAGLELAPAMLRGAQNPAAEKTSFSFLLLGDLHYDQLDHHDLEWLRKDKPDDLRQVQEYSRLRNEVLPKLFATLRETIADSRRSSEERAAFIVQVGDFVEGLCGSEKLAVRQDTEAIQFVRDAKFGVPFLFTKGNHDITGEGAPSAFRNVFHPFLDEQRALLGARESLASACNALEQGDVLFCCFDAYDKASLDWLEAALARRTARHCFVVLHPPVVPYGARATWHLYSSERERPRRERLVELLGKHRAFVLTGHIHKYNMLVRTTPGGGRFLQLALSSVIHEPHMQPQHLLTGVTSYNADQVNVEPAFSPATEAQRRAVYVSEAPFVKQFQYADMPGYAVIAVNGPRVSANLYAGVSREVWRTLELSELLDG